MSIRFAVRLTPRGGSDRVDGVGPGGELLARVRPAAAEGAANEALRRLVADALELAPSRVAVEVGLASRRKRLRVEGVEAAAVRARWPGLTVSERDDGR